MRVLPVEVESGVADLTDPDSPSLLAFDAVFPPLLHRSELLKLERVGLCVVLPALRQGQFVIPNLTRTAGLLEEEQVCRDRRIGREYTGRQTYDGVEVALAEE